MAAAPYPAGDSGEAAAGGAGGLASPTVVSPLALPGLGALERPEAPTLVLATINTLTVAWKPVEGASGYYCDYEGRTAVGSGVRSAGAGEWTGSGGRVVFEGTALLAVPSAKILGLQKNSEYVVRVTAVRKRRVVMPDGTALVQTVESTPSTTSDFLRTLNPGAELARLTGACAVWASRKH